MSRSLFSPIPGRVPGQTARIKAWVSEAFGVADTATVLVTELRCSEPGCPPLETVIALLGASGPAKQYKLHKAVAEVTEADVKALAAGGAPACDSGPRPGGGCSPP
jgi:hypothetical protein